MFTFEAKMAGSMSAALSSIDEITTRIKSLALSAAVEAARAGEAGRSFAVAASETSCLAAHVSQAVHRMDDETTDARGVSANVVALTEIRNAIESIHHGIASAVASACARGNSRLRGDW